MRSALLLALLALTGCGCESDGDPKVWNAGVWKSSAGCGKRSNPRYPMRESAGALLIAGMSRSAVERLLGPPDEVQPDEWFYCLGAGSGAHIDEDVLHVAFDEKGGLSWTAVIQH